MLCSKKSKSGGGCSWTGAISFIIICIAAGILIWKLTPWDDIIGDILPTFDNTLSGSSNGNTNNPTTSPTRSPEVETIPFSRCDPDSKSSCCNGLESNCRLKVNDIMYAASHNAMSSEEDGFIAPNHLLSLEKSLEKGYRALLLDLCSCGTDGLQLCHSFCAAGSRDPTEVFTNILEFLTQNPQEIIILVFQIGKDPDRNPISLTDLYGIMEGVDGFTDMMYTHPTNAVNWPSLGELISNNQRLIIFHHEASDCTQGDCPQGLHYYFEYAVETSFEFRSESDIIDYDSSCALDRGRNGQTDFYNINNFVTTIPPSDTTAAKVNNRDFLRDRLRECVSITGLGPNLVIVDFWSIGFLPEIVQESNMLISDLRK